ncbi:hypothetical protein [Demequina gelatinilytica]|uniref:hypothetical protein n=1 Tax=Demequina gelatinilytica TaxID=1638980 RepID=UPI000785BA42|nr:hypothetical protein [Demequina gelatinilytica]
MRGPAGISLAGTVGVVVAVTAGCDRAEPSVADGTPTATTASAQAVAPADDPELRALLGSFGPEIEGFEVPARFARGGPEPASALVLDAPDVVEPAECTGFHQASALATPEDLGAAADDLLFAAGWFFPGGAMPDEPPFVPSIEVAARVFDDAAVAADLVGALLGSGCEAYVRTATWDDGSNTLEHEVAEVGEIDLPGLEARTVLIVWARGTATQYDAAGEVVGVDTRESWRQYVHVDGVDAISIETAGLEDEQMVADVIAQFLDHMATG